MRAKNKEFNSYESGQALVLILLSLSVALTVVLFILSRSVTNVMTSTQQADSVRAFSAAEAGVEQALITGTTGSGEIGDATYSVEIIGTEIGNSFNYPQVLLSGDEWTLWFVSHDVNGNIICDASHPCFTGDLVRFCWGNPGTVATSPTTPAIEISTYYKNDPASPDFSTAQVVRAAVDPNQARVFPNSFEAAILTPCTIDGVIYPFQQQISLSALGANDQGLIFAKVKMLYNTDAGHQIGATVTGDNLPSQGLQVVSTGTAGAAGSQSNRKVSYYKSWGEFPFSGFAVFFPNGLVK